MKRIIPIIGLLITSGAFAAPQNTGDIASDLSNPLARIISVPFQQNWDYGAGPDGHGQHYYLQIQPVVPVELTSDWMLLSRTIIKLENEHNMGIDSATGIGDLSQSFFLSPSADMGGWHVGAGAVFYLPTATSQLLGAKQWGTGPTAVLLHQTKKWTFGLLASQTWGIGTVDGYDDRADLNIGFLQPFIAYQLPAAWTITTTSEYSYDWNTHVGTFPVNLMFAKLVKIGKVPFSFMVGGRYYLDGPTDGPEWGLRAGVTVVLPNVF